MTAGPTEPVESEQDAKQGGQEQKAAETPSMLKAVWGSDVFMMAAVSTICAMVVTTLGFVGYMKWIDDGIRIGVVNIENVMEAKQAQLALMVFGKTATEKEMGEAYDDAHRFGDRIHESLKLAEKECDCILLTSAAVVQGNPIDMTNRIKELVGLAHVDIAAAKAELDKKMRFTPSIFGPSGKAQGSK